MLRLRCCFFRFEYQLLISPIVQNLCTLFSYILCNPIYLVYLIFFSSYIFKVMSFLWPLVICIFILIMCIIDLETFVPCNIDEEEAFVLQMRHNLEEFGIDVIFVSLELGDPLPISYHLMEGSHSDGGENWVLKEIDPASLGKGNSLSCNYKGKQLEISKYGEEEELKSEIEGKWEWMKGEKEWKKSLACKLYEERNADRDGGEGMDLLWEIHEVDAARTKGAKVKDELRAPSNKCDRKKPPHEDGLDEDEEEEMKGQVCCMQAFKLSTGKMNMGIKSNNMLKLSRAIKGIGKVIRKVKR